MKAVVQFNEITKVYQQALSRKKVMALNKLSMGIEQGKIFGLLGPNGSGKTTAIKILLGLTQPSSGSVQVFDHHPDHLEVKKRIGYLPEETALYPFLTGTETVKFYAHLAGVKKSQISDRVSDVIQQVGLEGARNRSAQEYSKGMMRRLGLAMVLVKNPDLLVLDEPTIGLDPVAVKDFREMLDNMRNQGKTIILSSHLLGEIENICDEIAILYQGDLLKKGTLDDILKMSDICQISFKPNQHYNAKALQDRLKEFTNGNVSFGHPRKTLEQAFIEILNKRES